MFLQQAALRARVVCARAAQFHFARVPRTPLAACVPPPLISPPSEKPPHSGALARTAAANREGVSLAVAMRDRARSVSRSPDRESCCAPVGSQQSGSNGTTASRGNRQPGKRGELWSPSRCAHSGWPLGICSRRAAGSRPAGTASVCFCNPSTNQKTPRPHAEIMALMPPGYHLRCRTKAPNDLPFSRSKSLGAGSSTQALALAHIHNRLSLAHLAVQREVCQPRTRPNALLRRSSAQWANQSAIC